MISSQRRRKLSHLLRFQWLYQHLPLVLDADLPTAPLKDVRSIVSTPKVYPLVLQDMYTLSLSIYPCQMEVVPTRSHISKIDRIRWHDDSELGRCNSEANGAI